MNSIFSKQSTRVVRNDFTISFNNQWHQLAEDQPVTVRKKDAVSVEEWLDGSIHFAIRERYLNSRIIAERPRKAEKANWVIVARKPVYIPAANHPWRKLFIKNQMPEFLKTNQP